MITNQTIDGVPRELLVRIEYLMRGAGGDHMCITELRALLDASPEENGPCTECGGSLYTWGCSCTPRWPMYKKSALLDAPAETVAGHHPACRAVDDYKPDECSHGCRPVAQGEPVAKVVLDQRNLATLELLVDFIPVGTYLYAKQPAPVAVASLEIVGRQCFPSETMKKMHGYRTEPWVDGNIHESPSTPGLYTVEPLVRLSDVDRLNSKP